MERRGQVQQGSERRRDRAEMRVVDEAWRRTRYRIVSICHIIYGNNLYDH